MFKLNKRKMVTYPSNGLLVNFTEDFTSCSAQPNSVDILPYLLGEDYKRN